jgi:hypothetical protein
VVLVLLPVLTVLTAQTVPPHRTAFALSRREEQAYLHIIPFPRSSHTIKANNNNNNNNMSSIILCDKSNATPFQSPVASKKRTVLDMKLEDRRPAFMNHRLPMPPSFLTRDDDDDDNNNNVQKPQTKEISIMDQLEEVEYLLDGDDPKEEQQQEPAATKTMTYQEDSTWQEFCDDLPLE